MRRYEQVSGALFTLIALAQLTRSVLAWPAQVGSFSIPICLPSYWQSSYLGFSSLERHRLTSA